MPEEQLPVYMAQPPLLHGQEQKAGVGHELLQEVELAE